MRWPAVCLVFAGCATAPSVVSVQPDPLSGAPTAYATVFLTDDVSTRIVLSAAVGASTPINLTFWAPARHGECEIAWEISGHEIKTGGPTSQIVQTPSGVDQTVAFVLPPSVLRRAASAPTVVSGCGGRWALDDDDQAVLAEFLDALRS